MHARQALRYSSLVHAPDKMRHSSARELGASGTRHARELHALRVLGKAELEQTMTGDHADPLTHAA